MLVCLRCTFCVFFFFNDTATTEIYTLSLHDALPISRKSCLRHRRTAPRCRPTASRSKEHTSELQSPCNLVCRLLLEKKKIQQTTVEGRTISFPWQHIDQHTAVR